MGEAYPPIKSVGKLKTVPRDRRFDKFFLEGMVSRYDPDEIAQWLSECYAKKALIYGPGFQKDRRMNEDIAVFYGAAAIDRMKGKRSWK